MKMRMSYMSVLSALITLSTFASQGPEDSPGTSIVLLGNDSVQEQALALVPVPAPTKRPLPPLINAKGFFFEFGALSTEMSALMAEESNESFEKRKLLRLGLYVNLKRLPELFSLDPEDFVTYVDLRKLKKYIRLCADNIVGDNDKKVAALKSCFHYSQWDALLECDSTKMILGCIIDLFYNEDTEKEKLEQLKEALEVANSQNSRLRTYFNVEELQTILDDKIAGKAIATERIVHTINCSQMLTLMPRADLINKYSQPDKLLTLIIALICADDTENISIRNALIKYIRWDAIIESFVATSFDDDILRAFINIPGLKRLICHLQDDKPLTRELVEGLFNMQTFAEMGIPLAMIDNYIDVEKIIIALEAWRSGKQGDLSQVVNIPAIENHLGIDVGNALDTSMPEEVQTFKLFNLTQHITNAEWFPPLRYWTLCIATQLALWTAGHYTLYTKGLKHKMIGIPLVGLIIYFAHRSNRYLSEPTPGKTIMINTLICKGLRLISSSKKQGTKGDDLITYISSTHPAAEHFVEFFSLLTDEHLARLTNPYHALKMLANPLAFLQDKAHESFIQGLWTIDAHPAHTQKRINCLAAILSRFPPEDQQPARDLFSLFISSITPQMALALPHPYMLKIAYYWPPLLLSQTAFLRVIGQENITLLMNAVDAAQDAAQYGQ